MSWDAAIFGRLVIPKNRRKAWLDAALDWGSVPGHDAWDGYIDGETVRDVVEDVNFADDLEFLEVEWDGDEIRVQAFLMKDTFNENVLGFAAAWAAGAELGGRGELIGMEMGEKLPRKKSQRKRHARERSQSSPDTLTASSPPFPGRSSSTPYPGPRASHPSAGTDPPRPEFPRYATTDRPPRAPPAVGHGFQPQSRGIAKLQLPVPNANRQLPIVHEPVVTRTQEHQVRLRRLSALRPTLDVVRV